MKTKFTKKEIRKVKQLGERHTELEEKIIKQEKLLSNMKKERNIVFNEICRTINPDSLPFDKNLLPYGW